jgi:hypothetical protein
MFNGIQMLFENGENLFEKNLKSSTKLANFEQEYFQPKNTT